MITLRRSALPLYLLFFLSGLCTLGYQMAWARLFAVELGHELPAILAVIMAFLGGLALGAWALDGPVSRSLKPARWYGLLELVTGGWAILTILLIPWCIRLSHLWLGPAPIHFQYWLVAFAFPFALLLPATAAMGASLPAMERWLSPFSPERRCVGALYAVGTFGAVAGVAFTTLLLIPDWGLQPALLTLGAVNLSCGALVLLYGKADPVQSVAADRPPAGRAGSLSVLFATGLLGIGCQVVGIRALSQVFENTAYTFAAVLAVYLLGTSAGAAIYQRFGRSYSDRSLRTALFCGLSLSVLISLIPLAGSPALYRAGRDLLQFFDAPGLLAEVMVAAAVLLLPTFLMGATFSHLVQSVRRSGGGVGHALAANTLGSALAPLLFGAVLLPWLGIKWSFAAVVFGYLLLPGAFGRYRAAAGAAAMLLLVVLPPALPKLELPPGTRLLEARQGTLGSVSVLEYLGGHRSLRVDGHFFMGGTSTAGAARRQAHIPLLLHPDPRTALFLGVGTGMTLGAVQTHPELRADAVELVPEILQVLSYFEPHNEAPHRHPRIHLYQADARRFVRAIDQHYDVIVGDLFHPARDGAGGLYSLEHFQAVRQRLAPGGLFCQWISLFQLDEPLIQIIVRTFLEVFPYTHAYLVRPNTDSPVMGLVGTLEPVRYPPNWLEKRVTDPGLRRHLAESAMADNIQFFGHLLATTDSLRRFSSGAPINRDMHPLVTYTAPAFSYRSGTNSYGRLMKLVESLPAEPLQVLESGNGSLAARLLDYFDARRLYLRGLVRETEGDVSSALDLYLQSSEVSADFPAAYARCLLLAWQWAPTDADRARSLLIRLDRSQPDRPVARNLLESLFPAASPE